MRTTEDTSRAAGDRAADPPSEPAARRGWAALEGLNRYGLLLVFAAVLIGFSILRPSTYPTLGNFQSISSTQGVVALLALAAMLPLVVGEFDVSIGFQLGLSQTLCAGLIIKSGWPVELAIAAAVLSCCVVGVCNGLLVTRLRLPSFIATLGVGTIVLGLTQLYGSDETISGRLPHWFTGLGRNYVADVPLPFIYVLIAAAVLWIAFEYTAWGRECLATGGNPKAALLAGIRTERRTFQCFVGAGLLSGLAGVLSVTILGASAPTVGLGELLPAYAAAFLGATAIRPGRFNAIGTVVAVYLLAAGITGLQMLGAQYYVQQLFNGGALLIALTLSSLAAGRARASA
jgi:ribose transport system permease protein